MTNNRDPDQTAPIQTAPIGAVWSVPMLLASILKFVSNVRQSFAAEG